MDTLQVHSDIEKRQASRDRRWRLFRFLRRFSDLQGGVKRCMVPMGANVAVALDANNVAHVGGVARCASPWSCPLCAPTIREKRAADLDELLRAHLAAGGGGEFVTVTMPHHAAMPLKATLGAVRKGWTAVVSGRLWSVLKADLGILGQVKAVEITHGENGWHPHVHVLVVTRRPLSPAESMRLRRHVYDRWCSSIERQGFAKPSWEHGCDVRQVGLNGAGETALGRYVCKVRDGWGVGLELARSDVKRGRKTSRTPWELLELAEGDGDADALALWHEYEHATRGVRALVWSPGLRGKLGAATEELSDQEAATEEADEVSALLLVPAEWWRSLVADGLVAKLLRVVELAGVDAAEWWMVEHLKPQVART